MRNLLKRGDKGEDVKLLQKALGIKPADGNFGPKTDAAVRNFQGSHGLVIDGLVGPRTQKLIFKQDLEQHLDTQITLNEFEIYYLDKDEYHAGPNKPEYLFLHHTAGNENPIATVNMWNDDTRGRIATEFLIGGQSINGRSTKWDGVIVKCMPDGGYAAHLGANGSQSMHVNSVGIEVCNFGPLTKVGKVFKTYTGAIVHPDQVCDLGFKFRGFQYYHKYSDAQIEALRELILFIAERNGINIKKGLVEWLDTKTPAEAFDFNEDAWAGKVKGMLNHTNTRRDKSDMSPQPNLIAMLKSL
jgi:N-acetyl-anhydromuramyl-L-alanine amidase AmpD